MFFWGGGDLVEVNRVLARLEIVVFFLKVKKVDFERYVAFFVGM